MGNHVHPSERVRIMKKRLFFVILSGLMMLSVANAEEWVSIEELRVQAPSRWIKTYETMWRTIDIDAEINIPQVDKMPVVFLEGGAEEPAFTAEDIGWDYLRFRGAYRLSIGRNSPDYPKKLNGVRLGSPYAEGNWYSDFAPENQYVPLDDITFGEIIERAKTVLGSMGYEPECFLLENPVRVWAHHIYEYGTKKDMLPGYIFIEFLTKVEGIPVLSHVQESVRGDRSSMLDDAEFWQPVTSSLTYNGYFGDLTSIHLVPLDVDQVIVEDVPLLSFDEIIASIEGEINAGHIRKIYEIKLGYVLYNEPGEFHTVESGRERLAEGQAARYYARPMWQVTCLYKDTATEKLREKPNDSDDERNTLDYYQMLIDAQTGEVVRRTNAQDRCEYKGFLSWDEVQ